MNKINLHSFAETDAAGFFQVDVKAGSISQGTFTYTLEVNGKIVDTKKMILVRD
ncbi:MAG TPA: hypothetical protein VK202_02810 [Bacteroidia bacterium]|nr:hypothetical protein [Bacteroidia bacterium]